MCYSFYQYRSFPNFTPALVTIRLFPGCTPASVTDSLYPDFIPGSSTDQTGFEIPLLFSEKILPQETETPLTSDTM
jgi:hypothetical protein